MRIPSKHHWRTQSRRTRRQKFHAESTFVKQRRQLHCATDWFFYKRDLKRCDINLNIYRHTKNTTWSQKSKTEKTCPGQKKRKNIWQDEAWTQTGSWAVPLHILILSCEARCLSPVPWFSWSSATISPVWWRLCAKDNERHYSTSLRICQTNYFCGTFSRHFECVLLCRF